MKLLIAGDLVPTPSNINLFNNADMKSLLGEELLSLWNLSDIRVINLEVPLVDKENPITKYGPNFSTPLSTFNGIKALNPSLLALANNHIMDQGESGLKSTQDILNKNNIPFIGVGNNFSEARKPFIFQQDGLRIGFYACAEHEFSIATEKSAGANPFDPMESLDHIYSLKKECDYVIVLYHGGKEHYRYPSPYLQKVCRKIAEKGSDFIICQHSHCIGSFEKYNNSTIIYGQGNFIFDRSNSEYWQTSLLVMIDIEDKLKIGYIPLVKKRNCVRLAEGKAAIDIIESFDKRSREILQDGFIEKEYKKYADENIDAYIKSFSGVGKWISGIDRRLFKGKLLKHIYGKNKLLAIQNYLECEAHRELLIQGLRGRIEEK